MIRIFSYPPTVIVPNFIPLALERIVQLRITTFRHAVSVLWDFRQTASSEESKKEFSIKTFWQSTISMPSLFQYALLSTVIPLTHSESHSSYSCVQSQVFFIVIPSIVMPRHCLK